MADEVTELLFAWEAIEAEGGVALVERDLVTVTGPDAGRYLQGQLSQEVVALPDGASTWSLVLQPSGKVDAWLRVHRVDPERYELDVDAGWGAAVVTRLQRFLLRTKAEVGEPQRRTVLAWRDPSGTVRLDDDGGAGSSLAVAGPGVTGRDTLLPVDQEWVHHTSNPMPPELYERYRIAHGVPAMGAELTADTIPAEAGQWLIDASVSFTKGCYTGQELVARIDSRGGNVPRPVRLLVVEGESPVVPGAEVRLDGDPVGAVTSATPPLSPGHPGLALAALGRAVAVGATVQVESVEGWVPAGVVEPPFVGHGAA